MPKLKKSENFEPSATSKKYWLATRKNDVPIGDGGVIFPGLFQTHNSFLDSFLMLVLILLEAAGNYLLFLTNLQTLIPILLGFEIFFVVLKQYPIQVKLCRYKNDLILLESTDARKTSIMKSKIFKLQVIARILSMAITAIAIIKIGVIIEAFQLFGMILLPIAVVVYVLTAYFNICYTGYYLAEIITRFLFYHDKKLWRENKGNESLRRKHVLESVIPLNVSYGTMEVNIEDITLDNLLNNGNNTFVGAVQIRINDKVIKQISTWLNNNPDGIIQIPVDKKTWDELIKNVPVDHGNNALQNSVNTNQDTKVKLIWQNNQKINRIIDFKTGTVDKEDKKDYLIYNGYNFSEANYSYILSTNGVITDGERDNLIEEQDSLGRKVLAKEILFHQINNILQ